VVDGIAGSRRAEALRPGSAFLATLYCAMFTASAFSACAHRFRFP